MNKNTTRQKMMIAKDKHYFAAGLEFLIEEHFPDSELFHVELEMKKYNTEMVIEAAMQKRGMLPAVAEIYYRGDYVCEVNEKMNPSAVISRIKFALAISPNSQAQGVVDLSKL